MSTSSLSGGIRRASSFLRSSGEDSASGLTTVAPVHSVIRPARVFLLATLLLLALGAGAAASASADVTVNKTPDAQNINAGENVVFSMTVSNTGQGTATGVKLSDPLPGGVAGSWAVSGTDAADCVSPIVGGTLDCSFGDLAAGASKTVTVTAPTDASNCTTYDNVATVSSTNAPGDTDAGRVTCQQPAGSGVIVAMKGGDRNTDDDTVTGNTNYADPISGITFEYTTDNTLPQTGWTDFSHQSGANGRASTTVPAGTYYVREKTVGTNFDIFGPVQSLFFDPNDGTPNSAEPYVARVVVSNNGTTYAYPHSNNNINPNSWTPTNVASTSNNGSPFVNVRNNEPSLDVCGINILLVLDRSGSIGDYRTSYRDAAKSFVDQLDGTPTQIGITSFSSTGNSYSPATGNPDYYQSPLDLSVAGSKTTLDDKIDSIYAAPTGSTNWDLALQQASAAKGFTANGITGQSTNPDVVVFITDGNPTINETDQGGSGSTVSLFNLTAGMASANLVKNQDGRTGKKLKMLAIGVDNEAGSAPTVDNLKAVSGPHEGVDGDYAAPTVTDLRAFLAEYAAAQCGARVYIRKHLANDQTNQLDWGYNASTPPGLPAPTFQDNNPRTHSTGNPPVIETGAFYNQLPATPTTVTIGEDATGQPLNPFALTDVVCRYGSYDGPTAVSGNLSGLDYTFQVTRGDDIYCTFTNSQKTRLSVRKTPDNQTINAGDKAEFTIDVDNVGPMSPRSTRPSATSCPRPEPPPGR